MIRNTRLERKFSLDAEVSRFAGGTQDYVIFAAGIVGIRIPTILREEFKT